VRHGQGSNFRLGAKDFSGKLESAVGDIGGDAKTEAAGSVREATGTVQNLYGQGCSARSYGCRRRLRQRRLREQVAILSVTARKRCEEGAGQSALLDVNRGRNRLRIGAVDEAPAARLAAALAIANKMAMLKRLTPFDWLFVEFIV
jgi:uncharacterized protein YjbJ (UPF0337 family)